MAETLLRNSQVEYDDTSNIPLADESDRGVVIKATDQEVIDGIEDTKFITSKQASDNYKIISNGALGEISSSLSSELGPVTSASIFINSLTIGTFQWDLDGGGINVARIEVSDDNISWSTLYEKSGQTTDGHFSFIFSVNKYYRTYCSQTQSGGVTSILRYTL